MERGHTSDIDLLQHGSLQRVNVDNMDSDIPYVTKYNTRICIFGSMTQSQGYLIQ